MNEIFKDFDSAVIDDIARELKNPKALARANQDSVAFFQQYNVKLSDKHKYEIFLNNSETLFFVIPYNDNNELSNELLAEFLAAQAHCYSTTSSISTFVTYSCPAATLTSGFCLGTASTLSKDKLKIKKSI